MAKEKLPRLTESHVRKLASEKSFERGKNYYCDESILEPVRQGMELRAYSEGSDYEPYQVSAMLAKTASQKYLAPALMIMAASASTLSHCYSRTYTTRKPSASFRS
jgi:hypothetical protein